ncbi:MAG: FAD-dependent oxidoreductase [Polaromonas sp.]
MLAVVEVEFLTPSDIKNKYPLLADKDVVGGLWTPNDGQTNPVNTTQTYAKGAKQRGAKIFENTITARQTHLDSNGCYGMECITVRRESGSVDLIDDFVVEEFADSPVESLEHRNICNGYGAQDRLHALGSHRCSAERFFNNPSRM